MRFCLYLLSLAWSVVLSFYTRSLLPVRHQMFQLSGRRKPFRQNYPRKMKRILRSSANETAFSRVLNSVFEDYLKHNASRRMHEKLMKKIHKRARQLNITVDSGFAKRTKIIPPTILDWLATNGSFTTFINAANLSEVPELQARNLTIRYTMLIPTDAAFKAVKNETLEPIFADKTKLTQLLHHHMSLNITTAKNILATGKFISYLDGKIIFSKIDKRDGSQMIGNGRLVKANIRCRDGMIHLIDTVQIPR